MVYGSRLKVWGSEFRVQAFDQGFIEGTLRV
jgi:hypothetical protein